MPTDCHLRLYADAGGTKSTWTWSYALLQHQKAVLDTQGHDHFLLDGNTYLTSGINPNTMTQKAIVSVLEDARDQLLTQLAAHGIIWGPADGTNTDLEPRLRVVLAEVLYYGAGCGAMANREIMTALIRHIFQPDTFQDLYVYVDTDLAFAGLSQWGDEAGLVAILGTGCNVGIWQPNHLNGLQGSPSKGPIGSIIASAPSLGFWLGDEGGGAWVGKQIIKDYLLGKVPIALLTILDDVLGPKETIIQRFYQSASPAAIAGAVVTNLGAHGSEHLAELQPWLDQYARAGFIAFVQTYVLPLSAAHGFKDLRCVGGMAWHYRDILAEVVSDAGLQLDRVVQTPCLASK